MAGRPKLDPRDRIRGRYRYVAPLYPVLELALLLPPGVRRQAVRKLSLHTGDSVVEVGCGTGRNLPLLVEAVGPSGRVLGVDLTSQMLERARALARDRGWANVHLWEADAGTWPVPGPVDAVLFSLCYSVMPEPSLVLRPLWEADRPGGRVVVLDGGTPPTARGRSLSALMRTVGRFSVLGDPETRPWEDLRALSGDVTVEWSGLPIYFLCRAVKAA